MPLHIRVDLAPALSQLRLELRDERQHRTRLLQPLCRKPRRVATAVQYPNGQILSPVSRRDPLCRRVDEPVVLDDVLQHRVTLRAELAQRPQARLAHHAASPQLARHVGQAVHHIAYLLTFVAVAGRRYTYTVCTYFGIGRIMHSRLWPR